MIGWALMIVTIGIYAVIGVTARARTLDEYFVAGRRVPAFFNGMAIGADWMSAASFISMAGTDASGVAVGFAMFAQTHSAQWMSLSLLATLGEAYKVCQLKGRSLDPFRALHLATAGGARLLGLGDRIGGLEPGQEADFVLLDPAATPLLVRRTQDATLHDRLFALQVLGDDRAVAATFVAGRRAHRRNGGEISPDL